MLGNARPVRDAGETLAYTGLRTMVRAIVNAVANGDDPFGPTTEDLASLIRTLQSQDAELPELRKSSEIAGEKPAWVEDGGLWYYKDALYVPDDSATRAELMRLHHDDELAGHFGRDKTEVLLRRKYWWPTLAKDVAEWVKTCVICQTMKPRRHRPYSEAQALPIPGGA